MVNLVFLLAYLTAVIHFSAPFTSQEHLVLESLAVAALAVNRWRLNWNLDWKDQLGVRDVNQQLSALGNDLLHGTVANMLKRFLHAIYVAVES